MKLTLVSETFYPQMNGVSKTLGRLVENARANGIIVQLVIPGYPERAGYPGEVHCFSLPFPLYPEVRVVLARPGKVWKKIREFNPDLIHIATEATLGLAMLRKTKKSAVPLVTSYHTNFTQYTRHYYMGFIEERLWHYLRWFHNQAERTFCPSRMTMDELTRRGFTGLELFPRGVEADIFSPQKYNPLLREKLGVKEGEILAVYVGRVAKEKNLPLLIRVFKRLRENHPHVHLMIVGDGPIKNHIQQQAPEGITCVGYKTGEELAEHYASADLFVFPSLTETFGNVVIEALSSGLPAVVFRAGGVPQSVTHGENGLMAEPDDEETYYKHFETLCKDKALREQLSKAARAYALTQTWDRIFQRLFTSYEEVLQISGRPKATGN
jgi:glycosyltransferase involved in cell wall biosynthesis